MRRSTFKILFYVKKSGLKKNGHATIMGRITIDGAQTQFSTKMELSPEQWNIDKGKATGSSANAVNINRQLDAIRSQLTVLYNQEMATSGHCTPEKLKNQILGVQGKVHTLLVYFDKFLEHYKLKVGTSTTWTTYTKYLLTRNKFEDFLHAKYNIKDLILKELSLSMPQEFYLFLRTNKSANNDAMKHLQRLRAVLFFVKTMGYSDFIDPYLNFKMSFEKTNREYLEKDEIESILNKKFISDRLNKVRDIFIFSCYTGMSYADIMELKSENIRLAFDKNLWIMGERKKTGEKFNIRLLDIPKEIIEKYSKTRQGDKLLPCITNQKMNEYLKEIAALCGINKNLTFHVARHSFATLCLTEGVPIESVSKMLGHADIKTTQIYARIVDQKLSQDMDNLALRLNQRRRKTGS